MRYSQFIHESEILSLPVDHKDLSPSEYTLVLYFLLELTKLGWILDGTNSAGNTNTATHGILFTYPVRYTNLL